MGRGRPAHVPTDETRSLVRNRIAGRVPIDRIAGAIGLSENTLRKHYKAEIEYAPDAITEVAASKLFEAIQCGKPWAICFWLKCRARFRETGDADDRRDENNSFAPIFHFYAKPKPERLQHEEQLVSRE